LGVKLITVDKLLDRIGWRDPQSVIRFGTQGGGAIPYDAVEGMRPKSPGNVTDLFQKRRPQGKRGSAYDEASN
jgi:hypothetical protein